ncbi:MAG: PAS domain S-box protein, partial [Chloroflexales bacterium]
MDDQSSIDSLLVNERRLRALIEHSADGLALIDRHGVVRYVSPAAERITGLSLTEFVGAKAFTFVHPSDKEDLQDLMAGLLTAPGTATVELRLRHQDGLWRWVEAMLTNLLDEPDVGALIVNFRDVSSRRETEKELQQFANELAALHRQERRARMQAETLRKTNLALTRTLTLDVVLEAMFGALVRLVPYERASMILLREDEVTAVYRMQGTYDAKVTLLPPEAVDLDAFPPLKALLTAEAGLLIADTADGTDAPGRSWLGVPMRINGILMGLCMLEAAGPGR